MPLGLLGKKLGQTRVYDAHGAAVHVTVVQCGPNRVLQCRTPENDGYKAVQLGFGPQKPQRLTKGELGHLVKHGVLNEDDAKKARADGDKQALEGVAHIREFRDFSKDVKTGDLLGPSLFNVGDYVDVIGVTKGRGFEGVVKRHHFAGGDSTHGAKGWHRRSGAIGCRLFPGTVRRGISMPGHMGQVRRTAQNLEIIQVRDADHVLLIKGAIPGAAGDYVVIREAKKLSRERVAQITARAEERAKASAGKKGKGGAAKPAAAPAAAPATAAKK
jgi:large subunit ribosomal protein L3